MITAEELGICEWLTKRLRKMHPEVAEEMMREWAQEDNEPWPEDEDE